MEVGIACGIVIGYYIVNKYYDKILNRFRKPTDQNVISKLHTIK